MDRKDKLVETLVSQFETKIRKLPMNKLEQLESGKIEISFTEAVGHEAGGMLASGGTSTRQPLPTQPIKRRL